MNNKPAPANLLEILRRWNSQNAAIEEKSEQILKNLKEKHKRRTRTSCKLAAKLEEKKIARATKQQTRKIWNFFAEGIKSTHNQSSSDANYETFEAANSAKKNKEAAMAKLTVNCTKTFMNTPEELVRMEESLQGERMVAQRENYQQSEQRSEERNRDLMKVLSTLQEPVDIGMPGLNYGPEFCRNLVEKQLELQIPTELKEEKLQRLEKMIAKYQ